MSIIDAGFNRYVDLVVGDVIFGLVVMVDDNVAGDDGDDINNNSHPFSWFTDSVSVVGL